MHSLFNYSLNCEYPGIQLSIEGCKPSNVGAPAISASVPTSRHTSFIHMIIKKAHSSIYVTVSWESFPASAFFFPEFQSHACILSNIHVSMPDGYMHVVELDCSQTWGDWLPLCNTIPFPVTQYSGGTSYVHCLWYEIIKDKRKLYLFVHAIHIILHTDSCTQPGCCGPSGGAKCTACQHRQGLCFPRVYEK